MDFESKRLLHTNGLNASGHLNNALIGLVPETSLEAMNALARLQQASPRRYGAQVLRLEKEFKRAAARLVRAPSEHDIALVQNTSSAISVLAHSLLPALAAESPGANLVVFGDEYPSNREVWLALGRRYHIEVRLLDPHQHEGMEREEILMARCDQNTALVAISAVHYADGYVHDLARLGHFCHTRGIFLLVDAIQACGAMPVDVRACRIGALACGGHKWLMSPEGLGFLYIDPAHSQRLQPVLYGWRTLARATTGTAPDDTPHSSAQRFESGTQPNYLLAALNRSLAIIEDLGTANIQRYLWTLKRDFLASIAEIEALSSAPPFNNRDFDQSRASPILSLRIEKYNTDTVVARLRRENGISVMNRGGKLRVSPHIYNDSHTMERLAEGLKKICAQT